MMKGKWLWVMGAMLGGLAVAAGAFGTHFLEGRVSPQHLANFDTAARYQMYHALALLWLGYPARRRLISGLSVVGGLWVAGVILFSGSLYAVVLTGSSSFGIIAPVGGTCLIAGWIILLIRIISSPMKSEREKKSA